MVVLPDLNGGTEADTECVDSGAGRAETYLSQDVPTAVTRQLSTARPGRAWAVAGLSEGGMCAAMLALGHPDLFDTWADFAGLLGPRLGEDNAGVPDTIATLFGGSPALFAEHDPATLLNRHRYPGAGAWFETGDADPAPLQAATELAPLAAAAGIQTCEVVLPGRGHTFDVWSRALADALPWMAARTGAVPGISAPCPR